MLHVRDRKVVAPLMFILACIAGVFLFAGLRQGNTEGTVAAALIMLVLVGIGVYEARRPVELTPEEKRRLR